MQRKATGAPTAARRKHAAGKPVKKPARADAVEPLFEQLRGRKNVPYEKVAAHQRRRLHLAMIEAVARHGYTATTTRELAGLAGVTAKTLYRLFDGKLDCFLATYDLVVSEGVQRISAAYRSAEEAGSAGAEGTTAAQRDWHAGLCRAFDAFVRELALRPKRARLAIVEVLAVGPATLSRIEGGEAIFVEMIGKSLAQAPDGLVLAPELLKGVVGGIWYVARSRLLDGEAREAADAGRQLLDWMLAYRCPGIEALAGLQTPHASVQEREARRRHRLPGAQDDTARRMLHAVARIAAEGGYGSLTSGQITQAAGVSFEQFKAEFEDVRECFLAAIEFLSARALGAAMRAAAGAPDWPAAVCRAVRALLYEVAEDPIFARIAFVEIFSAGPAGAQRRLELMRGFATVLARRAPTAKRPSPLVAEAIAGAVWSLAHRHVVHGHARALPAAAPYACYLTLAPIIGAQTALQAILAEWGQGSQGAQRRELQAGAV